MHYFTRSLLALSVFVAVAPLFASAQVLMQAIGLFNVFVGLMLTVALLTYGIGFVVWIVRLGSWPSYRTEGVVIMEWSVVILFILVVLLSIVQFFQHYPRTAGYVVSTIAVLVVLGSIIVFAAKGEPKEDKH